MRCPCEPPFPRIFRASGVVDDLSRWKANRARRSASGGRHGRSRDDARRQRLPVGPKDRASSQREAGGPVSRICRTRHRSTSSRPHPLVRTSCGAHIERTTGSGTEQERRSADGAMLPRRASHVTGARRSLTCLSPYELPSPIHQRSAQVREPLTGITVRGSTCEGLRRPPAWPEAPEACARS